ncbi:MAG: hypothetical protein GTO18_04890 [Anaerolineales bacterium]|nr:hypothetical protein [Anaerolineales bacterium]
MTDAPLVCANHPNRETSLRCNRCEKPICSSCAVLTPVGYRCKECVRGQQSAFDTSTLADYGITFVISAVGVGLGVFVSRFLGFWGFLLAPAIGGGLAEIIKRILRGRRSRRLPYVAAAGGVLGTLPFLLPQFIVFILAILGVIDLNGWGGFSIYNLFPLGYSFLMISTLFYRLRGVQL